MKTAGALQARPVPACRVVVESEQLQIRGRAAAVTARLQLIADLLVVVQSGQPGAFDRRDMDEHVLAAIIGRDEAIAFGGVEPFYGAGSHFTVSPSSHPGAKLHPSRAVQPFPVKSGCPVKGGGRKSCSRSAEDERFAKKRKNECVARDDAGSSRAIILADCHQTGGGALSADPAGWP